ncbi:MAG: GFA family protein [Pseudomonadales bacterium]
MKDSISGQCHCGTVRWEARLPHKVALNCHCNMCRSLNGADYSSWVIVPSNHFKQLCGLDSVTSYKASENFTKSFCSKCGSTISCINNDKFPDHIYFAKGNITSKYSLPPEIQVYTKDKADWVSIDDSIPVIN